MEKVDFFQATKDLPISRKELAQKIASVPVDIARDYIYFLERNKNQLERVITLFRSIEGAFFHELIDQLIEEDLDSLNKVVGYLNDMESLDNIDDLLNASMNREPLPDNSEKVFDLLRVIKGLDEFELKIIAGKIIPFSWDMRRLSRFLLFYFEKKCDEEAARNHLKTMNEEDLDRMIADFNGFVNVLKEYPKENQA